MDGSLAFTDVKASVHTMQAGYNRVPVFLQAWMKIWRQRKNVKNCKYGELISEYQ